MELIRSNDKNAASLWGESVGAVAALDEEFDICNALYTETLDRLRKVSRAGCKDGPSPNGMYSRPFLSFKTAIFFPS